ncbi:D-alanyl-D-alanine carboxypeptidase/D-alanyl-D-alanine-endopeptidase [Aeromicrobium sp. A1-2]|uniref:D-alanyl-D-alanine carboxypeptidase/D-alanyl-D-alanine endopeptidase n=1 Tax=Aeromicrobium sp. A1-2 TaxID=2107713 RepID=UPI000E499858|nr:D-alanyl-D-alanine carboxypeptidase/D-alanyl-D-alanine-endopeptidase [Aeromicrobium sp. A1-2]AXT83834.1 D-alanyl-D-alanine carboxypeptidase/D-alanyl-D-alanine-endopeptidase [Aeromicrobium sp. A1-2]
MAAPNETRVSRPRGGILIPAVVLALVVALGIVLWQRGSLNALICDGDCGPSNVIPPAMLTTDSTPDPEVVVQASAGDLDPAKVAAAIKSGLGAPVLGSRVGYSAISPADGREIASSGTTAYIPASTTKVLTSFAALSLIDPQTTFATRVMQQGDRIVLVGGGDPYLVTKISKKPDRAVKADLTTLARQVAAALKESGSTTVRLGFDESLFTGPAASPTWEPSYVSENIATPVSALWVDQGVEGGVRAKEPAAAAARKFAGLLSDRGITVSGDPVAAEAPAGAATIGVADSATVARIVERLVRTSDNEAAEVMLRQLALAADQPATFDGGTAAVTNVLEAADVDTAGLVLRDGSGLSRSNRIAPRTLAETINVAATTTRTSGLLPDLPVSGFTGTLVDRFARLTTSLGTVRAKTGTLSGVHSLAGFALDSGGRPVVFALMADRTDRAEPLAAQAALDRVAASIAACDCGA